MIQHIFLFSGMIQPWDVFGFRIYKNYVRYISEFVLLNDVNVVLSQRNSIIKLQSLVYNQFCSPRYVPMFQYSWFKVKEIRFYLFSPKYKSDIKNVILYSLFQSGYLLERPESFVNPVRFCFHGSTILCSICQDVRLLTCSWCQAHLCFTHFFELNHLCYDYKP